MMIKYYDITENELNSKAFEAGSVYFCYDTLRIYYDSISDNKRIDISEFVVVLDTENERDGLLSPIHNKLYYIKENNKLYIYLNSEWFAINEPTTLAQLGITATATEINHLSGISSNVQEQINAKAPKKLVCTNITATGSNTYTCSHSFSEIKECHDNGGCVELHFIGGSMTHPCIFNITDISDDAIIFSYRGYAKLYGPGISLIENTITMNSNDYYTLICSDDNYCIDIENKIDSIENKIDSKAPKKLVCTVTFSNGTYICSHSFSEIKECHDNGGCVELHHKFNATTYNCIYEIYDIDDTIIVFAYYGFNYLYGGGTKALIRHIFTMTSVTPTTLISGGNNIYYVPSLPISTNDGGTGCTSIVDTTYTTARYRASALVSSETTPTLNGVINWVYE